jgi:hypothetical protein
MSIKVSADEAAWQLREVADEARWGVREAAWSFEERVLWRGGDAARSALRRALRAVAPLQRLVQTRLVWPLADRLDEYGTGVRTALATTGALLALGAGVAGAMVAGSDGSATETALASSAPVVQLPSGEAAALQGIAPDFVADPNAGAAGAAKTGAGAPAPGEAEGTPQQTAWRFAQAFALYEVGRVDENVAESFKATATQPLAAALGTEPPRLPATGKVPEAKVLNVVAGKRSGKEMTVSVSLLRLKAASELRLTLRETKAGWRVAGVLG